MDEKVISLIETTLVKLAEENKTDKLEHGYMPLYARYLPITCRSLLEVGVAKGASAKMWQQYFGRDCDIHLIDLFEDPKHVSVPWCRSNNFVPHKGDQSDIKFLYTINDMFDVIIEDGSHRADHMQITFKHLFMNNLKRGGLWITEDLNCCSDPFYWGGVVNSIEDTMLGVMRRYISTGELSGKYFDEPEGNLFKANFAQVRLHMPEGILFIVKK